MKSNHERAYVGSQQELRPHVQEFLSAIISGEIHIREIKHTRELQSLADPTGVTIHMEPTGYETFTFEVGRRL